jgi:hypothetical protein
MSEFIRPLQVGQVREDTGLPLLPQPVALAADVDGRGKLQKMAVKS